MQVADFDYNLPEELIAQEPVYPRDSSRLLVLDKVSGAVRHSAFRRLEEELRPGDTLVINDTKVLPARIFAHKETGAQVELLLLKQVGLNSWQTMVRPGRKALPGTKLLFDTPDMTATITDTDEEGTRIVEFHHSGDFYALLEKLGEMPLPPYIKKHLDDQGRYQPVYARERGSAAAPTAGLHFTEEMLEHLQQDCGVNVVKIMLHVGLGTFRPVKADTVEDHHMHAEFYRVTQEAADAINAARAKGGRIIAVGTTSVRTLESVAEENGHIPATEGWTQKYIYPGYKFKAIDGMITNFHLPKSTLIMLVSALAGRENVLNAYEEAIRERYRFFSFGDAMLII
ncbi:MAG: tRNA preQ1(34) S-adenosylmethionine ribosyltransferase-isomerase QueA [Firmicutes bacterium]|nr:tRNA preQ1(34) S-adenosylmethionine ribosyltransferase-isomerase QueA [Bacillota bacterium]MBQ6841993.1 tRNA preQ1(34) S-adenosylmethionine ribosyltransferase-isomerase QueA [Bacillota bacterium]